MIRALVVASTLCLVAGMASAQGIGASSAMPADVDSQTTSYPGGGSSHFAWADVLRVEPVYKTVSVQRPRRECHDVRVTKRTEGNGTAGAVVGAVVGGLLGNTVGKGDGRQAATVAGAVVGGAVGHGVATRDDGDESYTRTECSNVPVHTQERRISSYNVEYRYQGDVYMSRLAYDPGDRIRVRVSVTPVN